MNTGMNAARQILKPDSSQDRLLQMLNTAFGTEITSLLNDRWVIEVMLNPDGHLWVDRLGEGCSDTGENIAPDKAQQVIELVANATNTICNAEKPLLSAELPGSGHRFEGLLPPVVINPTFTIRKKAVMVYTLDDYVKQGVMSERQKGVIIAGVYAKKNFLIAGGTGSGKTTLLNAILDEIAKTNDRIVIIEDTIELQCEAPNKVPLRTQDNISMNHLLASTMRLRPDRIVIGEVRGPEALTLVKSWNTGHPGGACSIHCNSCKAALRRMESLIQEAVPNPQREIIAEAVNIIIYIEKCQQNRRIKEMVSVEGFENGDYLLKPI
jgi:type IV secretion system protein VirB11